MSRLLIVSNDRVGSRMAGPGIRSYHFARELAARFDVTLLVPGTSDIAIDGVTVVERAEHLTLRQLKELVTSFDAVVAQQLPPRLMRHLARSPVRTVYDLYDPLTMENLGLYGDAPAAWQDDEYRAGALVQELALATGDAFVCASERQRDLWLGALSALGRLDLRRHAGDPSLRSLIDVVPFGLEAAEPSAAAPALKGVAPGIGADDRVVLWGGGIWNWLDPLTPIRAVARLAQRRGDVRLYFLGLRHPNPGVPEMAMAQRAVELADELGVRDRSVFFNFGWVPYAERTAYLLEADLGISAHLETVEARFAFRTRVLDYLWARLPVVATRGDALADLVRERDLGRTVDYGDAAGWADAIDALLDASAEERVARRAAFDAVRSEYEWPRVVEPLARAVAGEPSSPASGARSAAMLADHVRRRARLSLERRGLAGTARLAAAKAARATRLRRPPPPDGPR